MVDREMFNSHFPTFTREFCVTKELVSSSETALAVIGRNRENLKLKFKRKLDRKDKLRKNGTKFKNKNIYKNCPYYLLNGTLISQIYRKNEEEVICPDMKLKCFYQTAFFIKTYHVKLKVSSECLEYVWDLLSVTAVMYFSSRFQAVDIIVLCFPLHCRLQLIWQN